MATIAAALSSALISSKLQQSCSINPSTKLTPSSISNSCSFSSSSSSFLSSLSSSSSRAVLPVIFRNSNVCSSSSFSINASSESKKKVLIVNTNSGGHAVIGFYFAKQLLGSGHQVTILTVGEESSDKMKKPPFNRFSEITSAGGKTVWGSPAEIGKVVGGDTFDVVLDNNGKDLETVRPVVDWAKSSGVEQFLFISSAGIYKPTDEPPHVEGDVVKADASHVGVEEYIATTFSSWATFRPQYMIGSGNNKDCEEWFFDRIVRDRPIPIPGSGMQLTNISHVRDLASMLTLAVENPAAASGNIFNCVSDRAVTLDGMAKLCAQAAGRPVNIVHYDPKAIGIDAKKAFPFRNMHFYAEPRAAKELLGWEASTYLPEDLKERYEEYVKIGRDKKEIKFELDDKILEALKVNECVKRARAAQVHALIISHLKKEMPILIGKVKAQEALINNLDVEFRKVQWEFHLPAGDFPDVEHVREVLKDYNLDKFERSKPEMIQVVDDMLSSDIPELLENYGHHDN